MRTITIHGYSECFLINSSVKVYKNNGSTLLGKVERNSFINIEVEEGETLIFKSGLRTTSLAVKEDVTDILLQFDRYTGALGAFPTNKDNVLMIRRLVDNSSSHATLKSVLLILIPLLLILLAVLLSH